MNSRAVALTLAVAGATVVVNIAVADSWLIHPWWVVAPGLALVAVVHGVRRNQPEHRLPWQVLIVALGLLWAGWSLSAWIGAGVVLVETYGAVGLVRDLLYIVAYPLLGLGSLLMVRARTGGRDRDNVIDALIVMTALATTIGAWVFGSTDLADTVTSTDRLWTNLAPLLMAAVVSATIRLLMAGTTRLPAAWLLLASSGVTLVGNIWTTVLLRAGEPTQSTAIDILWVLGFVLLGAATLHPSMRHLTEPADRNQLITGMPVDRLVLLAAALVSVPLAHLRMAGDEHQAESVQVVIGGVLVAVLAIWRVARLLRERDEARQALAEVAEQEAFLATVARWALGATSTEELFADVDAALAGALPEVHSSVVGTDPRGWIESQPPDEDPMVAHELRIPVDDGADVIAHVVGWFDDRRRERAGERTFLEAVASVLSAAAQRRAGEERLRHDALHDRLTGLPNRTLALDRLHQLLGRRDTHVAVLFLDLNGFKAINDTLGHEAGDAVLRNVAGQLREAVRADDTVARYAGDEFMVVAGGPDRGFLATLVARVQDAATTDVVGESGRFHVTASIGVATTPSGGAEAKNLIRQADAAMYRAKRAGGGVAWASENPWVGGTDERIAP